MEGYRWKASVVTLSDKGFAGEREDKSGPLICEMLTEAGYDVQETVLLPDEMEEIKTVSTKIRFLCYICTCGVDVQQPQNESTPPLRCIPPPV